jgi:hypothetical protein
MTRYEIRSSCGIVVAIATSTTLEQLESMLRLFQGELNRGEGAFRNLFGMVTSAVVFAVKIEEIETEIGTCDPVKGIVEWEKMSSNPSDDYDTEIPF